MTHQSNFFDTQTKYLKWYLELLEKHAHPKKVKGDFLEGHHKYPRFAFGDNADIVYLDLRCHFLAHLLLYKHAVAIKHPLQHKAFFPLQRMSGSKKNQYSPSHVNSKHVAALRRLVTEALQGENNPFYGKKHTAITRSRISKAMLGRVLTAFEREKISFGLKKTWAEDDGTKRREVSERMTGRHVSEETRRKISLAHTGKILSQATKDKISAGNLGKLLGIPKTAEHAANISKGLAGLKKSDEHVDKINRNPEKIRKTAEKHRGMKRSDETKAAISASKIGKPAPNSGSITFYDSTTFERFKFPKDASDIPEHLVRGMGPGMTPKEPKVKRQVFYNPETMEVLRIPSGDEVPPGFVRGNPVLMGERGPRSTKT